MKTGAFIKLIKVN